MQHDLCSLNVSFAAIRVVRVLAALDTLHLFLTSTP